MGMLALKQRLTQQTRSPKRPMARRTSSGPRREMLPILHLQRTLGNHAVLRLLQSNSRDVHEQEADRIAKQVMGMPAPERRGACACGGTCPRCQNHVEGQHAQAPTPKTAPPSIVHASSGGRGQPLDPATRAFFEPRLGHDLSMVRVHADSGAAESARSLHARAYTYEHDIVFNRGQYAPQTREGERLLAHELVHVVQQRAFSTPRVQREEEEGGSGERLATSYRRIHMLFNGDEVIVSGDGNELFRYGASSGRPVLISEEHARECGGDPRVDTYMSPRFAGIKNKGPIPEGTYRFSPSSIQEFSTGEQLSLLWGGIAGRANTTVGGTSIHSGDWGAGRVHLRPVHIGRAPCGHPERRSGFFLHGGLLAGSSGCIDIGTSFDELATFLRGYSRSVTVTVKYETETPRVGFLTGFGGALAYSGFHFRHGPTARLGVELGSSSTQFVTSAEYQVFLDWAGGALSAGLHVDVPMNDEEAFIRAGLRGGAEFRLLHALYGQLSAGGFVESAPSGSTQAGTGFEVGSGLSYDFGRPELSLMYNYLKSSARDERHQVLLGLGFHW